MTDRNEGEHPPTVRVTYSEKGSSEQSEFEIRVGQHVTIGRSSDNDVVIPGSGVSRYHAELAYDSSEGLLVRDVGSRNGTRVNDEPILEPRNVTLSDTFRVSSFVFTFHDSSQSAASSVRKSGLSASPSEEHLFSENVSLDGHSSVQRRLSEISDIEEEGETLEGPKLLGTVVTLFAACAIGIAAFYLAIYFTT